MRYKWDVYPVTVLYDLAVFENATHQFQTRGNHDKPSFTVGTHGYPLYIHTYRHIIYIYICTRTDMYIYIYYIYIYNRRKFRSQTSDNMDRWKAEQGRGREKRKIRREKIRRERVRRKKMQMREKVGKSRNTGCFSNDLRLRRVEK